MEPYLAVVRNGIITHRYCYRLTCVDVLAIKDILSILIIRYHSSPRWYLNDVMIKLLKAALLLYYNSLFSVSFSQIELISYVADRVLYSFIYDSLGLLHDQSLCRISLGPTLLIQTGEAGGGGAWCMFGDRNDEIMSWRRHYPELASSYCLVFLGRTVNINNR